MLHLIPLFLVPVLAQASHPGPQLSPPPSLPTFRTSRSKGNVEVVKLVADHQYPPEFWDEWASTFPSDHPLHHYHSHQDPAQALTVINAAFCFCMEKGPKYHFLPPALVAKLQNLAYDPQAPCALVIRGLPIDPVVPPTATTANFFDDDFRPVHAPVAETMLLGLSRLVGILHGPRLPATSHLVRDTIPNPHNDHGLLNMHRDYARPTSTDPVVQWEPQFLVLLCVREGSTECRASTLITDMDRLWKNTSPKGCRLLSQHKVQLMIDRDGQPTPLGHAYHPLILGDDDTDRSITLNDAVALPGVYMACPTLQTTDPELASQVLAAYKRLSDTAMALSEPVALQPGDILVLNNSRCVHGRTGHHPKFDGTDRWLIKTYVSQNLWGLPGRRGHSTGPSRFPNLDFPH